MLAFYWNEIMRYLFARFLGGALLHLEVVWQLKLYSERGGGGGGSGVGAGLCLTDGRRKTYGSEQRVVIRPGHLATARRAPTSRCSLTRWQELRTARSVTPHGGRGRGVNLAHSPASESKWTSEHQLIPKIKGSAVCGQAGQRAQKYTSKPIDLSKVLIIGRSVIYF